MQKRLLIALLLSGAGPLCSADLLAPRRPHPAVCEVEWRKISGRVEAKDADHRSLRLRDKNGNVARVIVDERVQIFRDWRLVALTDVRLNDRVVLRRAAAGL